MRKIIIFLLLISYLSCKESKYEVFLNYFNDSFFNNLFDEFESAVKSQYQHELYKSFVDIDFNNEEYGLFVRVKKDGTQRGCIGFYKGVNDFSKAFKIAAIDAFMFDRRFKPLQKYELQNIEIQVTICAEFTPMLNKYDFDLDKNIVMVTNFVNHAFMQNTIAIENHYNKAEFIKQLEIKAGIDDRQKKNLRTYYFKALSVTKSRYYNEINIEE